MHCNPTILNSHLMSLVQISKASRVAILTLFEVQLFTQSVCAKIISANSGKINHIRGFIGLSQQQRNRSAYASSHPNSLISLFGVRYYYTPGIYACRGVYSFHLSIRLFVHSYVCSFAILSCSWNYFKVLR